MKIVKIFQMSADISATAIYRSSTKSHYINENYQKCKNIQQNLGIANMYKLLISISTDITE